MLQALIFDVDGTLAETEEVHRAAFNAVFDEMGLGWHWDRPMYGRLLDVTGGKERITHFIATEQPPRVPQSDGGSMADAIAAMHRRKTDIYNQMVASGGLQLRPGVEAVVRAAKQAGVRLAIATTTSLPNVESLLSATLGSDGIAMFEAIAAGDMVAKKKPAPDVFLLALEKLALPARACLALEDSLNGLHSAQAAGLSTFITRSAYTAHQDFKGALAVRDTLGELGESGADIIAALRALHG
ncbi:MAG: HAD-IA family hydrolase [Hyphomicrobiaceae bacterium]